MINHLMSYPERNYFYKNYSMSFPDLSSLMGEVISKSVTFWTDHFNSPYSGGQNYQIVTKNEAEIDSIYDHIVKKAENLRKKYPSGSNPLYYRKIGTGPEIFILIHGMVATSSFWEDNMLKHLIPHESERFTFIIPDLAGYGKSLVEASRNYSVDEQIDLIRRDILIPEGIEFFNLIGHSYGGLIALHLAGAHSHRILNLILMCPAYFSDPFAFDNFVIGNNTNASSVIRWMGRLETSPYVLRMVQMVKPIFLGCAAYVPESILPYSVWNDLFETSPHTTIMTILGIRATGDLSSSKAVLKQLSENNVFLNVIHGAEDWVVPLSSSKQLCEDYPFSKLIVLEGVGHHFPVTASRTSLDLIMKVYYHSIWVNR